MAARTTVQVPATPSESLVTHCTSGLEFQFPRTVTPFRGLWRQSCTVIRTVADQVSTPLTAQPSRFPTCMLGAVTVIAIARALLLELASGRSEEHTSELQSRENLVCRLLLEKKKKQ